MHRLIGTVVLVISLLGGWVWMDYRQAAERPSGNLETVYFEILRGQSLSDIATRLAEQQLITHPRWFKVRAYLQGHSRSLKFGEYEILPGTNMGELIAMFAAGRARQYAVTFVEGSTFSDVRSVLSNHAALDHQLSHETSEQIMARLGAAEKHPEGQFFPDTYFFPRGTPDIDILERAHKKMKMVLQREWDARAAGLPYATPYEALIVASIVEKESAREDERAKIAGVFVRRLMKGMRLQTDPTVIYGLGQNFDGNLRKADLKRDTPYNTYVRAGLPPTPIAMPGLQSIRATLNPDPGSSLYFVARGDGSHVFSDTLDEHQRAVQVFQIDPVRTSP